MRGSWPPWRKRAKLFVGVVLDHLEQPRIGAENVLANVGARFHGELLHLAVDHFAEPLDEQAFGIALEEGIPVRSPDNLDDVPARAAESGFEFLDDLSVAAHRTVQALQVAVDDENQIVEALAGGQRDRAERFGFVGFAVAEERPDLRIGGGLQAAILEVAVKAGLIDGHDGAKSHRNAGILPEIGHQPRMGIGGKPAAGLQFAAEIFELLDRKAAFEEGPGIDAGRGMALEINGVAFESGGAGAEEVVEANLEERGRRAVGGDVAADIVLDAVGADDHGQRVPANQALDPALHVLVAGERRFLAGRNRIDVRSVSGERDFEAGSARPLPDLVENPPGQLRAALLKNRVK